MQSFWRGSKFSSVQQQQQQQQQQCLCHSGATRKKLSLYDLSQLIHVEVCRSITCKLP
jgi:hypothetical protein